MVRLHHWRIYFLALVPDSGSAGLCHDMPGLVSGAPVTRWTTFVMPEYLLVMVLTIQVQQKRNSIMPCTEAADAGSSYHTQASDTDCI